MYGGADIRNGYYGKIHYDKNGNETSFQRIGKAIVLEDVSENIENGEVSWHLKFAFLCRDKHYVVNKKNMTDKKLIAELGGQGADVTPKHYNLLIDSLRKQEDQFWQAKKTYKKLGWIRIPDDNNCLRWHYRCDELIGSTQGEYTGIYILAPKGTFDGWHEMVQNEVIGNIPLETVLLAALSAVVVGLICDVTTGENPIIHINFASGQGKSTVCYLACSVSGEPFDGMKQVHDENGDMKEMISVYGSWGSTERATVTTHSGNHGIVAILNELGKFVCKDMTSVIFNLSEGSDVKRLNESLDTVLTEGFNTTFLSCGEMSLIGRCKTKLQGVRNRVMEIATAMTNSAEHSRRIKEGSRKNNGFAAPMLAEYIVDNGGKKMVKKLYEETLKELTDKDHDNIPDRFIEKFPAYFITTAKLAKEALDIEFNVDEVTKFCYECYKQHMQEVGGDVDESYEDIIGECSENIGNFYDSTTKVDPKVCWGSVKYPNQLLGNKILAIEYGIKKKTLKELLEKHGHTNIKTCLDTWKKSGVLNREVKHDTRVRQINSKGTQERLYVLQVWQDVDTCEEGGEENAYTV